MDLQIKRLTAELLEDWLAFFDHIAFTDNEEWAGCYCMCYHWNSALNEKRNWDCSRAAGALNRQCAIELIQQGRMQGYLAYADGKAVGWCNANDKAAYDNVNFTPPSDEAQKHRKVKAVMCFCVALEARGQGVASRLLERVCADAALDGYDCVEAYPFLHDEYHAYHGPKAMYEKAGFEAHERMSPFAVFRKECR